MRCESTCARRWHPVRALPTFKLKWNKIKRLPQGSVPACTLFSALGLESCFTQSQCETLTVSVRFSFGDSSTSGSFSWAIPFARLGHTQSSWKWDVCQTSLLASDTTIFHCPGGYPLVGQSDWNKISVGTLFSLKKSLINPQKHYCSDEEVSASSQIAAPLILGPW